MCKDRPYSASWRDARHKGSVASGREGKKPKLQQDWAVNFICPSLQNLSYCHPRYQNLRFLKNWKADNHILSLQIWRSWASYKCFKSRITESMYSVNKTLPSLISTQASCEKIGTNNERKTKSDGIPTPGKWKKIQLGCWRVKFKI